MPIKLFSPDDAYEQIKDSKLYPLVEHGPITGYWQRKYPDSYMMATLISFSPYSIVISGDLHPGRHGVIIPGYGLDWFSSQLSPDYLASKCLDSSVWDSDRAKNDVEAHITDLTEEGCKYDERDLIRRARAIRKATNTYLSAFDDAASLRSCLEDAVPDYGRHWETFTSFGFGYNVSDYAWLSAIQRRFAETYHEYRAAHSLPTEPTHV